MPRDSRGLAIPVSRYSRRRSRRSSNDRLGEITHPHVHVLQFTDRAIKRIPHALLSSDHHHEQIRACAEIVRFVAYHQTVKIFFNTVERFRCDLKNIIVKRVHLGMEFNQRNAIADVI